LELTPDVARIRSIIGGVEYQRQEVERVVEHRGWLKRGIFFETRPHPNSTSPRQPGFYGFLTFRPYEVVADLRRMGWPVVDR
jgi:hypothetical protein